MSGEVRANLEGRTTIAEGSRFWLENSGMGGELFIHECIFHKG